MNDEDQVEEFFQVTFTYTEEAYWRGHASSAEDAQDKLKAFFVERNVTEYTITDTRPVPTMYPEGWDEKVTLN